MIIEKVSEEGALMFLNTCIGKDRNKIFFFLRLTVGHVSNSTDIPVGDIRIECSCSIKSYTRKQRHEKQKVEKENTHQEEKE